jgi:hypothetical protein
LGFAFVVIRKRSRHSWKRERPPNITRQNRAVNDGGWHGDYVDAVCWAACIRALQSGQDIPDDISPAEWMDDLDNAALFGRLLAETQALVNENWPAVERVAAALVERKHLTEAQVDDLIRGRE